MPSKTITLDDLPAELQQFGARDRVAAVRAMVTAAHLVSAEATRNVGLAKPFPLVDTGELRRSYRVQPRTDGAVVENVAPHAAIHEFGARPFTPPIAPLFAWAKRKLRGKPREDSRTVRKRLRKPLKKGASKRPGSPRRGPTRSKKDRAAMQLARRAQAAIKRRGIFAKGFHAQAVDKAPAYIRQALLMELRRVHR